MPPSGRDKKIDEMYELVRKNNKMLRSMRRNAFIGGVLKLIFWAIMLGVPIYLYFAFFQPILAQVLETYTQIQETGAQMQQAGTEVQGLLDQIPLDQLQGLLGNIPGLESDIVAQ